MSDVAQSEIIASACAIDGNYKKIEELIDNMQQPTTRIYNSLIKSYMASDNIGKIHGVIEKFSGDNAPEPNDETFYPLILDYIKWGLKGHAKELMRVAFDHGCINGMDRVINLYYQQGDIKEITMILRMEEDYGDYDPEEHERFINFLSIRGPQGYDLIKKHLVYMRRVSQVPLRRELEYLILFGSTHANDPFEPYKVWEYFIEKYPTFHTDGPNHVLNHLLKLDTPETFLSDKIRKCFFRSVARGFRFSDEVVNETLLYFYRYKDYKFTYIVYEIMKRDVYQIFTEAYVPIIKSALHIGTKETLQIVPDLLMGTLIPEAYRVALLQLMVDMENDPSNPLSLQNEFNLIFEYLKLNVCFDNKLYSIIADYFLSKGDVLKAISVFKICLERYHLSILKKETPYHGNVPIPPSLIDKIEILTKSKYSNYNDNDNISLDKLSTDPMDIISKKNSYNEYLSKDLLDKYSGNISSDDSSNMLKDNVIFGRDENNQNKKKKKQKEERTRLFFSDFDTEDTIDNMNIDNDTDSVLYNFFSIHLTPKGKVKSIPRSISSKPEIKEKGQSLLNLSKDTTLFVRSTPTGSIPKNADKIGRNFVLEREQTYMNTGLEHLSKKLLKKKSFWRIERDSKEKYLNIISDIPKIFHIDNDFKKRLYGKQRRPFERGYNKQEPFEFNAINRIKDRNSLASGNTLEFIEEFWENILTFSVANKGQSYAQDVVDNIISQVPFANPPSKVLCNSLHLSPLWRNQFD